MDKTIVGGALSPVKETPCLNALFCHISQPTNHTTVSPFTSGHSNAYDPVNNFQRNE